MVGNGKRSRVRSRTIAAKVVGSLRVGFSRIKSELVSTVQFYPPCRIMSYTLRDRCDETNRADEAAARQVAREISARARRFPRPSFDTLH